MTKSREEYNAYMREYMLRRYHEHRVEPLRALVVSVSSVEVQRI
jgi:hypothetical protein